MQILVTNDDGISSQGLWTLVRELNGIGRVTVVAPDSEQSAIGTAVHLRQPLRIQKKRAVIPKVAAYSTDGTPSDSVLLALGRLVNGGADIVVSGINHGLNLGEDVYISGTVGAALQGYLHGCPALAISAPYGGETCLDTAARVAAALVKKMSNTPLPKKFFFNINLPDLPLTEIAGARITRLARESHVNTVEEGSHGRQKRYRLQRQRRNGINDNSTDIWAIEHGYISITPLYFNRAEKPPRQILNSLCLDLRQQLKNS